MDTISTLSNWSGGSVGVIVRCGKVQQPGHNQSKGTSQSGVQIYLGHKIDDEEEEAVMMMMTSGERSKHRDPGTTRGAD